MQTALQWLQAILPALSAAGGAYAAIHVRLSAVERAAARAHERIDNLYTPRTFP